MDKAEPTEESRMSLGEHLEELRYRLIMGLIGPVIAAIVLLYFAKDIIAFICQPLLYELKKNHIPPTLYNQGLLSAFLVYMKVAILGGLIIGIPWLFYQLWLFVAPGLLAKEQMFVRRLVPFSAVLAALGVAFMYYVMLPLTIWFMVLFTVNFPMPDLSEPTAIQKVIDASARGEAGAPEGVDPQTAPITRLQVVWKDPESPKEGDAWVKMPERELRSWIEGQAWSAPFTQPQMSSTLFTLDEYISLVMLLSLAFAVAFQLPLVMLALGWIGIFDYGQMAGVRKYAFLGCFIVGALLTPADPFSQIALAVPLYLLYELGLLLVRYTTAPAVAA